MYLDIPISYPNFEKEFPGWATLFNKVTERFLTSGEVRKLLKITRQQLDYWLEKGVLYRSHKVAQKWQRFSILDVVLIAVAQKFKSKGTEIKEMYHIREKIPTLPYHNYFFVYIINGYEVFIYSDFEGTSGVIALEDKDHKEKDLVLKLTVSKETSFLSLVSLKKICDHLAKELDLPHFRVNVLPDGRYEFFVNQVPLRLESLRDEDVPRSIGEFQKRKGDGHEDVNS